MAFGTALLPISAQTTHISPVSEDPHAVYYSLTAHDMPGDRVLHTIKQGMRSRITYTVRVFREVRGISRIFGDRPLAETQISKEARLDPFSGRYILTESRGTTSRYDDSRSLLQGFFGLEEVSVPKVNEHDAYVMGRSRLEVTLLQEPLRLLMPFLGDLIITTPWSRIRMLDTSDSRDGEPGIEETNRE